jgi:SAM-dependent methyltransferase
MTSKNKTDFWNEKPEVYADLKEENRKTILFPAVLDLLAFNTKNKVLDYGGGDGGFLEFIKSSVEKHLYDPSEGMIEYARKNRSSIKHFYTSDEKLPSNAFDIITLIHVVTVIKEDAELNRIFLKIKQLLKNKGTFVIGMTHPAFKDNYFSTFHTDFSSNKLNFEYLVNSLPYFVHLNTEIENEFISFECYHRPISNIMNMLIKSGFEISSVVEVEDKNFKDLTKKYLLPPFLIVECKIKS